MNKDVPLAGLLALPRDARIALLQGTLQNIGEDFGSITMQAVNGCLNAVKLYEFNALNFSRVLEAFQRRVEFHLVQPGMVTGGDALAHLPQHMVVSQELYKHLDAAAAGLAGMIYFKAGYESLAKECFLLYGWGMALIKFENIFY